MVWSLAIVKYFRLFCTKCYIKRDNDTGKFDARSDEGMFLGYSLKIKSYRCYNLRTKTIVESTNVRFDEKFRIQKRVVDYNSDDDNVVIKPRNDEVFFETNNDLQNEGELRQEQRSEPSKELRVEIMTPTSGKNMKKNHPPEQIIGSIDKVVMTRSRINEELCLISQVEPKNVYEACKDDYWKQAMKEELDQIVKNVIWELVPRPAEKNVIGTKWVFKNKMNEQGEVLRNKARLVCKSYSQQEGIDYDETYAHVPRIEAVRLFLAYATHKKFKVYQMDVRSEFLNGELEEEVYTEKPEGCPLIDDEDIVCKLKKALYGLKKAPRTWYAMLDKHLTKLGFG